jgi:hypothetical protein
MPHWLQPPFKGDKQNAVPKQNQFGRSLSENYLLLNNYLNNAVATTSRYPYWSQPL